MTPAPTRQEIETFLNCPAAFKTSYAIMESPDDRAAVNRLLSDFDGYAKSDIVISYHYHKLSEMWIAVGSALLAEGVQVQSLSAPVQQPIESTEA